LVYYEKFSKRIEAISREKYFKTASGRRFIKSLNLAPYNPVEVLMPE
jgi:predicted GIY-YIG superfamily endonuclease